MVKRLVSCQHSRVDRPLDAEMAVRLRYVGVAKVIVGRKERRERRMNMMI